MTAPAPAMNLRRSKGIMPLDPPNAYPQRPGRASRAPVRCSVMLGSRPSLLNNLIGPQQQRLRDGEAKRLGGLEIDNQLELGGLLDGEIGRLRAFQNLVHVDRRATKHVAEIGA